MSAKQSNTLANKLKQILKDSQDWERIPTTIDNVYLQKLPETKNRKASLTVAIDLGGKNPLRIANLERVETIMETLSNDKVIKLIQTIQSLFSTASSAKASSKILKL